MKVNPIPIRPPGMSDAAYKEIMRKKRRNANIVGTILGCCAVGLLVFPYYFVNFKNGQNALKNNTNSFPGEKSVPIKDWERDNGKF